MILLCGNTSSSWRVRRGRGMVVGRKKKKRIREGRGGDGFVVVVVGKKISVLSKQKVSNACMHISNIHRNLQKKSILHFSGGTHQRVQAFTSNCGRLNSIHPSENQFNWPYSTTGWKELKFRHMGEDDFYSENCCESAITSISPVAGI